MIVETVGGFIAYKGDYIFAVNIAKELAMLDVYLLRRDLDIEGVEKGNETDGMVFGDTHLYLIVPELPPILAIGWYMQMVQHIPEAEKAMQRFIQRIAETGRMGKAHLN
jgi:hypothetical protein